MSKEWADFIDYLLIFFLEIVLHEKAATDIEIAEDALGDEVYYYFMKNDRKIDESDLDEERM